MAKNILQDSFSQTCVCVFKLLLPYKSLQPVFENPIIYNSCRIFLKKKKNGRKLFPQVEQKGAL